MTTMDLRENPTFTNFIAMKLAARRARKAQANAVTRVVIIVRLMMHIVGFSFLTMAGFSWNITAGLIVAGISCFAFSYLATNPSTSENGPTPPRMR